MSPDETILSLDPSSTAIGWAVVQLPDSDQWLLTEGGVIRPEHPKAPWVPRVREMADDLAKLLDLVAPTIILIETTLGHVHRRIAAESGGAGLSIYGAGVGAALVNVHLHCCRSGQGRLVEISANEWTRGVPKDARQAAIASECRLYDPASDPGGDLADAIGLVLWWLSERLIK